MEHGKLQLKNEPRPLFEPARYEDTKDPCPVFDGRRWHIYGSGGSSRTEEWQVLHAIGSRMEGPWIEAPPVELRGVSGPRFCAPGVVFDAADGLFHMFIHTECFDTGNRIEHLVSRDGHAFDRSDTSLASIPHSREAGTYDPHPALITGRDGRVERYLTYSGFPDPAEERNRADIYLAKSSGGWNGPWERLGPILRQEDIPHHNQQDGRDYEWGLEGAQLIDLGAGWVLLNAVCFLPHGPRGTRQRVFFAMAKDVRGPYESLGPILDPSVQDEWAKGENGHAAGIVDKDELHLFYQARGGHDGRWRYGRASLRLDEIIK
jgi:hypothetical protein